MKVVCDNCGAVYKIPEHKLVKEVNKATCRKCGHRIMIRKDKPAATPAEAENNEEATVIAEASTLGAAKPALEAHPPFGSAPEEPTPAPTSPMDGPAPAQPARPAVPAPLPMPTPGYGHQPSQAPAPAPNGQPLSEPRHDPTFDLSFVMLGAASAGVGTLLLALLGMNALTHFLGLFMSLWGVLVIVLIVVTGLFGRRSAWVVTSVFISLLLSIVFAAAINPLTLDIIRGDVSIGDIDALTQRVTEVTQPTRQITPTPAPEPVKQPDEGDAVAELEPPAEDPEPGADDGTPQDLLDVLATEEPEPEPDAAQVPEPEPVKEPTPTPTPRATSTRNTSSSSSSSRPSTSSSSSSSSSSRPSTSSSSSSSSSSRPSTSSTSSSSSSSRPSTSSTSSSSSSSRPSSGSSSSSAPTAGLSTTVVEIQIRNNKNIKSCFLAHRKSTGELPPVTLRFTLENHGKVSNAYLKEAAYQGTALESCLSGSIKMIDFPPFDGDAVTMNYPFRF